MWIVRWLLIGIIFLIILGTTIQNSQLIELTFLKWQTGQIPIYLVIYVAFAAGMLVVLLISAYHQIQRQFELSRCRKEIKQLQQELDTLQSESTEEGDKPAENSKDMPDPNMPEVK